jgi:hypothetical protein
MHESNQLITALDVEPMAQAVHPARRLGRYRALAWAASIVIAVGLGFVGRSVLQNRDASLMSENTGRLTGTTPSGPVAQESPRPTTTAPTLGGQAATEEQVATRRPAPAEGRPAADAMSEADRAPRNETVTSDAERRVGADSMLVVDSLALRSQIAANRANEPAAAALKDAAAGAGAPAQGAVALSAPARERSARQAEAQPLAPAAAPEGRLQSRDEAGQLGQKLTFSRVIPMEEAVRVLGGSIRLIDSLTPVRVEMVTADSVVRVVYATAGVEVWLDQRRIDTSLDETRMGRALQGQRLDTVVNSLSWNDLHGFYLVLTGPLPETILQQMKARIR